MDLKIDGDELFPGTIPEFGWRDRKAPKYPNSVVSKPTEIQNWGAFRIQEWSVTAKLTCSLHVT
jgi:hypothetical protein